MKFTGKRIQIEDIDAGDRARREHEKVYDERTKETHEIKDLIQSIRTNGLINPITLADKTKIKDWKGINTEHLDDSKPYLLLAGGRRLFAFISGEIAKEIDARISDRILSSEEIKTIELEENLRRVGLTWSEEVTLKERIHNLQQKIHGKAVRGKKVGHSIEDTAEMLDQDRTTLVKDIGLAKAMQKMPELATARTKADARKMLKKLQKDIKAEEKALTVQKRRQETPLDKQRKNLYDSYILKDFFSGIKGVERETIDIVELDPPYAIDLKGEKRSHRTITDDYNEIDKAEYEEFMTNVLTECYRVMKAHSWLVCWFGPDPWFGTLLEIMRETGFTVRGLPGIWSKGRGQTQRPALYLANAYEMFFYARKGEPGIKKQGRINTFDFPPVAAQRKNHPTERPIEMIEEVLRTFSDPDSRVLVPFLGSGNTLLAASNLGMSAFGYDLVDTYRDYFVEKVSEGQPGGYRSYGG